MKGKFIKYLADNQITDIKDFSKITETMKPVDLVKSLDNLFREFDKIIEKHQIEKIKTIGDLLLLLCVYLASIFPSGPGINKSTISKSYY